MHVSLKCTFFFPIQYTRNIFVWQETICCQPWGSNSSGLPFYHKPLKKCMKYLKNNFQMLDNRQCRTVIPQIGDTNEVSSKIFLAFPLLKMMYELWARGRLWNSLEVSWVTRKRSFGEEVKVAGICWGKVLEKTKCFRNLHRVLFDTVNRNFYMQGMKLHEVEQRATCGKKNYQATLSWKTARAHVELRNWWSSCQPEYRDFVENTGILLQSSEISYLSRC